VLGVRRIIYELKDTAAARRRRGSGVIKMSDEFTADEHRWAASAAAAAVMRPWLGV